MPAVFNYFGIPARGEATRVALAVAGVDFEDKRMSFEEFGSSEFKTLPVYQVSSEVDRSYTISMCNIIALLLRLQNRTTWRYTRKMNCIHQQTINRAELEPLKNPRVFYRLSRRLRGHMETG